MQLSPADVKAIDPLGMGASPTVLQIMSKFPVGNDPLAGADHPRQAQEHMQRNERSRVPQ